MSVRPVYSKGNRAASKTISKVKTYRADQKGDAALFAASDGAVIV